MNYMATFEGCLFFIQPDNPEVGVYLWRYVDGASTHDYLQNSVQDCMEFAEELWGVPATSWIPDVYSEWWRAEEPPEKTFWSSIRKFFTSNSKNAVGAKYSSC